MQLNNIDISIVLPVYNCYPAFVKGASRLRKYINDLNLNYELIVVNDGSEINFEEINNESQAQHCTLIAYKKNMGKGYAVKKGVEAASGKIIMYMDGDLPFDYSVIKNAADIIFSANADIVIGDRTDHSSLITSGNKLRKLGSKVVSDLANFFLIKSIPDTQCGFKAFKQDVAKKIFSEQTINGYSFDIEILFLAQRYKYIVRSVPVVVNKQVGSSVRLIWHGFQMIITIIKLTLKNT